MTLPSEASVAAPVTIVMQMKVAPGVDEPFAEWRRQTTVELRSAPGFVAATSLPPSPPVQVDWALLYRFTQSEDAHAWLGSDAWQQRLAGLIPILDGNVDVSLLGDDVPPPSPVTLMIATRVVDGAEEDYKSWIRRMDAAQSRFPGYEGYKLVPPVPGVQSDWVTLLRFDSEAHLQEWMASSQRQRLLDQSKAFTSGFRTRTIRSGFDQWFPSGGPALAPVWKQDMLVLLALYPVVYLFGVWVGTPLLRDHLGLPFWLALFIGNIVSIVLLNWLVPWLSRRFGWWLQPAGEATGRTNLRGVAILGALYAGLLLLCSHIS